MVQLPSFFSKDFDFSEAVEVMGGPGVVHQYKLSSRSIRFIRVQPRASRFALSEMFAVHTGQDGVGVGH